MGDPIDDLVAAELASAGFDLARPQVGVAWGAFKRFARVPVPPFETFTTGFTCENHDDRDRTLWMQFNRQFTRGGHPVGRGYGCGFCCDVPDDLLGVMAGDWWWPQHGVLDDWFARVEAKPEFVRCLAMDEWRWVGYAL